MTQSNAPAKPLAKFELSLDAMMQKGMGSIPKEINADRLKLNALMAISQDNNLSKHAQQQPAVIAQYVFNFVIQGLDMLNREAYIVPYNGKLTPVIDYKGQKKLAQQYSTKPIKIIKSGVVRENDTYKFDELGNFKHVYDPFSTERGELIGAFCTIIFEDEEQQSIFANKEEIEKVKNASPSSKSNFSPWVNWTESMWEKTVIRKAMKYINIDFGGNEELARAYRESDKDIEFTRQPVNQPKEQNVDVFDAEFTDVEEEKEVEFVEL